MTRKELYKIIAPLVASDEKLTSTEEKLLMVAVSFDSYMER